MLLSDDPQLDPLESLWVLSLLPAELVVVVLPVEVRSELWPDADDVPDTVEVRSPLRRVRMSAEA